MSLSPSEGHPMTSTAAAGGTDAVEFYTRKKVVTSRW